MSAFRHHWLAIALACLALATTAWAALTPIEIDAAAREQVYVIPKGTFARRMAGEKLEVLPAEIRLTVGVKDILVMKNEDDVPQLFGPVLIMPGQSFRLPFRKASRYQFICNLHASGQLEVIVDPMPEPGWARLRARVGAIARPATEL